MATKTTKIKKQQLGELPEIQEEKDQSQISEKTIEDTSIFVPDIPAQMVETLDTIPEYAKTISIEREVAISPKEKNDSDEILFLNHLLYRQHSGGFGKHLDDEINERVKYLRSCL